MSARSIPVLIALLGTILAGSSACGGRPTRDGDGDADADADGDADGDADADGDGDADGDADADAELHVTLDGEGICPDGFGRQPTARVDAAEPTSIGIVEGCADGSAGFDVLFKPVPAVGETSPCVELDLEYVGPDRPREFVREDDVAVGYVSLSGPTAGRRAEGECAGPRVSVRFSLPAELL